MITLLTIMNNPGLLIRTGFRMMSEDEEKEPNDNRYYEGTISEYTKRISDLGRRKK